MSNTKIFDISLPRMQAAFEQMEKEAGWDTKDKLFWGYYFLDQNQKKLEAFGKKLESEGYQIVELRKIEESNLSLLHVEEHVVRSPESLFKQCHELAKLAEENKIEIFDGWDVEPIQMNKGLAE